MAEGHVLLLLHIGEIGLVQVTNIDRAALEEVRYDRAPLPNGGDVPLAALIGTLEAAGYRGWYEDETIARIPRRRAARGPGGVAGVVRSPLKDEVRFIVVVDGQKRISIPHYRAGP